MRKAQRLVSKFLGYAQAIHFGPTVLVVTISFLLSRREFSTVDSLRIAAAIFAGQCVVGWSNDLVDCELDSAAQRMNKPLVAGKISSSELVRAIYLFLALALALSFFGPMGAKGTAIHALGLLSATAYNFRLKKTLVSILPYIVSFGLMPVAVYVSAGKWPTLWLELLFITFASSFHFLNVLKDLELDLSQGVLGLPQRLGKMRSIIAAILLASLGLIILIFKWKIFFGSSKT